MTIQELAREYGAQLARIDFEKNAFAPRPSPVPAGAMQGAPREGPRSKLTKAAPVLATGLLLGMHGMK
jgi:hypothetical protein